MPHDEADEYRELLHTPGGQLYLIETLTNRLTIDRLVALARGEPLPPLQHAHDEAAEPTPEAAETPMVEPASGQVDATPAESAAADEA
jgi:hypothetical protein